MSVAAAKSNAVCHLGVEIRCEDANVEKSKGICEVDCPDTNSLLVGIIDSMQTSSCEIHGGELKCHEQIGEGQFGLVYKGTLRGKPCAIKRLKGGITKESVQYQRLIIELSILTGVGVHPNIVSFLGACIEDLSAPLLVEELVDGENLEDYLSGKSIGFNLGRPQV